jgi:hypothetical protein
MKEAKNTKGRIWMGELETKMTMENKKTNKVMKTHIWGSESE